MSRYGRPSPPGGRGRGGASVGVAHSAKRAAAACKKSSDTTFVH